MTCLQMRIDFAALCAAALSTLALASCGGGGSSEAASFAPLTTQSAANADVPANAPATSGQTGEGTAGGEVQVNNDNSRGSVVGSVAQVTHLTAEQFKSSLQANAEGQSLLQVAGSPKCGIATHYLEYNTVGGKGEATNATAAILVPTGDDPQCAGARPVLLYAHGTTPARGYNLAQWTDVLQPAAPEGALIAAIFAAQGYIVVAPNYAGYDKSTLPYHPYINGNQQGKDMMDALTAARKSFSGLNVHPTSALFISGYSQGGYVALAANRELQAANQAVTATAPLSAPSAISLLTDYNFLGLPALGSSLFVPLLTTSWQQQLGNVYNATSDIYEAEYATGIEALLPNSSPDTLFSSGKLPQLALYPAGAVPGPVAPALSIFYGPHNLVKQSYLTAVSADISSHPCPGNTLPPNPASLNSNNPLDCAPSNGFRQAAVANDLRNWLPKSPLLMCGGANDPTVNFASTLATAGYFRASGMPAAALTVVDLEASAVDAYSTARAGFLQAKTQVAQSAAGTAADKATAVTLAYHGTLVPPFCLASARDFFQHVPAERS